MSEPPLDEIAQRVAALESDDAFVRRDAIDWLTRETQRRFDYDWRADAADRGASVQRWRTWLERRRRAARTQELGDTLQQLTGGQVDPAALGKLMKNLDDPQEAQAVQSLIAKLAAAQTAQPRRPICETCRERPATVELVEGGDGAWRGRHLCETCASDAGI